MYTIDLALIGTHKFPKTHRDSIHVATYKIAKVGGKDVEFKMETRKETYPTKKLVTYVRCGEIVDSGYVITEGDKLAPQRKVGSSKNRATMKALFLLHLSNLHFFVEYVNEYADKDSI